MLTNIVDKERLEELKDKVFLGIYLVPVSSKGDQEERIDSSTKLYQMSTICVLKNEDGEFINLCENDDAYVNSSNLFFIEPISNYYKDEEYRLVVSQGGRTLLDVDTQEPIDEYDRKYTTFLGLQP